jgi:hypothetical protein
MSKFMQAFGALFLIAGIIIAVSIFAAPGQMQILALTPEVAAIFLVGGSLCLGVGSLLDAPSALRTVEMPVSLPETPARSEAPSIKPVNWSKPADEPDAMKPVVAASAAVAAGAGAAKIDPAKASPGVVDTINALEQAKTDIAMALGIEQSPKDKEKPTFSIVPPAAEKPAEKPAEKASAITLPSSAQPVATAAPGAAEDEEEADDPDLYVVEEKVIRGRPARVLSDGTVEAETDEGWMRFENLEHLDEYLEAMAP